MPRDVDPRDLRRAEAVFQENLPRSFGIELADLSRDRWSVIPKFGDLVAEMNADRAHLTYMKSTSDAGRHPVLRSHAQPDHRDLPVEGEAGRRAGRSSTKTTRVDFDIVNYDIDAELRSTPGMDRRQGHAAADRAPRPDLVADPERSPSR